MIIPVQMLTPNSFSSLASSIGVPQRDRLRDGLPECNSFCAVLIMFRPFCVGNHLIQRWPSTGSVKAVLQTMLNKQWATVSLPYGSVICIYVDI